jgi:IS5 family transposase
VLRLEAGQVLSLWDELLPVEARELPEDLGRIDALLSDPGLLAPIRAHWQAEADVSGRSAVGHGRPTIAMGSYVRLMVIKQRTGWGYETLVREVSDSLHLRRFCLIAISERLPDESTIRKLTRRLGHETVDEITRLVIAKAQRETRFVGRAVRVDSTVVEADIRYPSDAMLALQGTRALAREGRKLAGLVKGATATIRDRSRSVGRTVRQISRTLARRTGEARRQVIELNSKAGTQIAKSAREARRLAAQARRAARAAARRPSCARPPGSSSSPSAARRSQSRSAAARGG